MFPINTANRVSLIEKASEKTERAKEETVGELTHGNKQISNCCMYYYIGLEI